MPLHEELQKRVEGWRESGYKTEKCPALAEVLQFNWNPSLNKPGDLPCLKGAYHK